MSVKIQFDQEWKKDFVEKFEKDGPWANLQLFKLAMTTEKHLTIPTFEGLVAPKYLQQLTPLPHQLETAQQVVENMNGKAILADEVGLGKTIEAGLILKEYMIRGLVKKALILVPASLVSQWVSELNEKFHIPAVPQRKSYVWDQFSVVVSSIDTAKRSPHQEIIAEQNYDLIVIDEAHKLKNPKTKNYQFVQSLKKKFCLLLTATPIQNKIEEIFHLVSLLKPGHLGSESGFLDQYKNKKTSLQQDEYLKELVNKVMIRNRRGETGVEWPERHVESVLINFSKEEKELYDAIDSLKSVENGFVAHGFSLLTLKREACSSREAVFLTLKNMFNKIDNPSQTIIEKMNFVKNKIDLVQQNSKAEKALELIQSINDKVIIFTEYRATQLYLQWFLQKNGIRSVPFRGGFKRGKKDWMRELFKNHAQVLIATEAGGEGINLQFCSHIINFDLPWNPMRLEQRIGRIHRLGQENNVHIYNFSIKDTIEEHILKLLYEKINLFERIVGELDEILTKFDHLNMEEYVKDIFQSSHSEGEMKIKMENLSSIIQFADTIRKDDDNIAAE
ncbi:DEAD/DEAH box helicase [Lederbergia galactosidilytica]|uniref:ATP-dependent helicase n=1 Tax=Lederbergia galactosidilytica TaxID=217031 RepID=A0A178A5L7_9BACI|nr:SNF2-related protein [Lederbergia galactosidilytica]KRG15633.1 ATP-dependent helicase [Virgibacillus soli]MBP1914760.1 SNF2 family DNA or RNA helicase [Lederbergia galactosidilytica]OAK75334.1 ATP-dependent helicase [Lederbergia galactosidilytica]